MAERSFPRRFMALTLALTLSALFAPAPAQDRDPSVAKPEQMRRVALVIGNGSYQHAPKLNNPLNDARDMATLLRSFGFDVIAGEDLSADGMKRLIQEFGEKLSQGQSVGLFYYAGHGAQINGNNYLIPTEANILREKTIEFDAVDVGRVLAEMDGNSFNIVILDACRNNPFTRSWRSLTDGLAQINAPTGTLIAYATAPNQVAGDGDDKHGTYTQALLEQMRKPGLPLMQLFMQVRAQVKRVTAGRQVPWESSSLVGDFYFVPPVPTAVLSGAPSAAGQRDAASYFEICFWEAIKTSSDPEDLKDYLKRFPEGTFVGLVQRRLAAINKRAGPSTDTATNSTANNANTSGGALAANGGAMGPKLKPREYHALVIGNSRYQQFPQLKTPEADVRAIDAQLRGQYGFETRLLLNATRQQILSALSAYRRELTPDANLLIYYAGHGYSDNDANKAYWLPVDAERADQANWISADNITAAINVIPARHVLVISDSSFSGALTRSLGPSGLAYGAWYRYFDIKSELKDEPTRQRFLQKMMAGKSRTLMASGSSAPVADDGGNGHSLFASALLRGLTQIDKAQFTAAELFYNYIAEAVAMRGSQTPEYNPLRNSGHESGDFVFDHKGSDAGRQMR